MRHKELSLLELFEARTQIEAQQPGQHHRKVRVYMDKSSFLVIVRGRREFEL